MKKRWLCGVLVLCMALTMLPGFPLQTGAYEDMTVTQELVDFIKKLEGFSKYPYDDNTQYTVGYGSECPDDKYEEYMENGIPEEEAEALLREDLDQFESEVNSYAEKHGLTLKQHEFDALVSFSFNCGGNWRNETYGTMNQAIRTGATGTDLIYALGLYSRSGTDYVLIQRRLCEANMYLNGVYLAYNKDDNAIPSNYKYIFLDGNGGRVNYVIHGYDAQEQPEVKTAFTSIPTGVDDDGNAFVYTFAGWYTAANGGTRVEKLDGTLSNGTILYARWKDPDGNFVTLPTGDVVDNLSITVKANTVKVRTGPGTYYAQVDTLTKGDTVVITETYTASGITWGKCSDGWFSLANTDYEDVLASLEPDTWPQSGTVNGIKVNVRSGPGTSYEIQYKVNTGDRVTISETAEGGGLTWGKLADGNWICMDYVILDSATESTATVTGITLLSAPIRTEYVQMQDQLDLSGSILQVNYSDGTATARTLTASMISGYSNAVLGTVTLTVSHQNYTVTFKVTIVKATVTFCNYDGTVLSTARYAYGDTVTQPATPVKPADEAGEYRFVGWDPEVTTCDGDATYTAVFELAQTDETDPDPEPEPSYVPGDMDGDGAVDEDDAIYLLRHVFFPENYPVSIPADFDGSGTVDEDDAIYLLRYVFFPENYPLTGSGT